MAGEERSNENQLSRKTIRRELDNLGNSSFHSCQNRTSCNTEEGIGLAGNRTKTSSAKSNHDQKPDHLLNYGDGEI